MIHSGQKCGTAGCENLAVHEVAGLGSAGFGICEEHFQQFGSILGKIKSKLNVEEEKPAESKPVEYEPVDLNSIQDVSELQKEVTKILQTGKGADKSNPIQLNKHQIQKLLKAGIIKKDSPKIIDVGLLPDVRISVNCSIQINRDTWAVHPESLELLERRVKESGYKIRTMSRAEKRRACLEVAAAIERWKKEERDAKVRKAQEFNKSVSASIEFAKGLTYLETNTSTEAAKESLQISGSQHKN